MSTTVVDEDFRRRLRLIMQQFGSVADLARAVGVSDNAIYKWVSGRGQPSIVSLVNLASAARVSVEWLATGHDLPAGAAGGGESAEYTYVPSGTIRGPGNRTTLQSAQLVAHLAFRTEWLTQRLRVDPTKVIVVEVVGDSMSPTVDDGDLVLADLRESRFRHDGIYVLRSGADLSVKRVQRRPDGKLIIRSDNPAYEPAIVTNENINIVGYVIWAGGQL